MGIGACNQAYSCMQHVLCWRLTQPPYSACMLLLRSAQTRWCRPCLCVQEALLCGFRIDQAPGEAQDCMIHILSSSMVTSDCNRSASKLGYAGPAFQGCTQAGWLLQYCGAAVRASALLPCLHPRFAAQLTMPAIHKPCNIRLGLHSVCLQDCNRVQQWSRSATC